MGMAHLSKQNDARDPSAGEFRLPVPIGTRILAPPTAHGDRQAGAGRPNEGGRSSGAAPNCLFGCSPISNTSVPPLASSACPIQLFVHGLPFHVTACMYGRPSPLFRVSTTILRPPPTSISARSTSGLPNTQFALTGSTAYSPSAPSRYYALICPQSSLPARPSGAGRYIVSSNIRTRAWVFQCEPEYAYRYAM